MATFEEIFLYPLILLFIGAGVSGLLVSWLTNRWEDHRKEGRHDALTTGQVRIRIT